MKQTDLDMQQQHPLNHLRSAPSSSSSTSSSTTAASDKCCLSSSSSSLHESSSNKHRKGNNNSTQLNTEMQRDTTTTRPRNVRFNGSLYELVETRLAVHPLIAHSSASTPGSFFIDGYCPSHIRATLNSDAGAELWRAGLRPNDLLIKIDAINCCRATHKTIRSILKRQAKLSVDHTVVLTLYRSSTPRHTVSTSSTTTAATKQQAKQPKQPLFAKLFKSSSAWLSCAASSMRSHSTTTEAADKPHDLTFAYTPAAHFVHSPSSTSSSAATSTSSLASAASTSDNAGGLVAVLAEGDTGYETISSHHRSIAQPAIVEEQDANGGGGGEDEADEDTLAAACCSRHEQSHRHELDEERTRLIGSLIELEAEFVAYMSEAVATFTRPLRGFFIKQSDYFTLFQNTEKLLIISEHFLRSMDKWSAYDLYTRIGQLYTQKMRLFHDAFATYVSGHAAATRLYAELCAHSKQFRLFLDETQQQPDLLTLAKLIDLPLVHLQRTLDILRAIQAAAGASNTISSSSSSLISSTEMGHLAHVIAELSDMLAHTDDMFCKQQSSSKSCAQRRSRRRRHHHHHHRQQHQQQRLSDDESGLANSATATVSDFFTDSLAYDEHHHHHHPQQHQHVVLRHSTKFAASLDNEDNVTLSNNTNNKSNTRCRSSTATIFGPYSYSYSTATTVS